jgi:Secretion system C-terminal sorting domain
MRKYLLLIIFIAFYVQGTKAQQSVARKWNDVMIQAIQEDLARPPVQARNLFHVSLAMYDAWAVYDATATTYLLGKTVGGIYYPFTGVTVDPGPDPNVPVNVEPQRNKAISYAAYRVLRQRFQNSPNALSSLTRFDNLMTQLGYDKNYTTTNYTNNDPADLGNYIAQKVIEMGLSDGARQAQNYGYLNYTPFNTTMDIAVPGNPIMEDPNRWQPLTIAGAFDQNGNPVPALQRFVCPEWGRVLPFAMLSSAAVHYTRDGADYPVYYDPGAPPRLDTVDVNNTSSQYFKWGHAMVAAWSSHLTPDDATMWDVSPKSMGNVSSLPTTLAGQQAFYNFANGGDPGTGYAVNPVTGLPYVQQMVKRGDFTRVVSQYWADGPSSETPPGHWYVLLKQVSDYPGFQRKYEGVGPVLSNLEWDIKTFFALGGSLHDAAIACWSIKGWYDTPRPISAIRKMAKYGQSSNSALPSYHPGGLPLMPGFIELVAVGDPLAGAGNINVNKIKIKAWRGFGPIVNPYDEYGGVGWILAENWIPYQRRSFVTPPFAGYLSGHSTYSRAGAQMLTMLTGSPYFPGGLGEVTIPASVLFLGFENGPTATFTLQWASYKDASDQASLSRIWGGIHPPFDDIPGRIIGEQVGTAAHNRAKAYFTGAVLPVQLLSFTAKEKSCSIQLKWVTASEQSSKSFTILRSEDGINFTTKIGEVRAAGNSATVQNYIYNDEAPQSTNYYKLIQTDEDGTNKSYDIQFVALKQCNLKTDVVSNIYPNPVQSNMQFVIKNLANNKTAQIIITDVLGKIAATQIISLQSGINNVSIPTQFLKQGNYFVKTILGNGKVVVQKMVKVGE